MDSVICFICNTQTRNYRQNFNELRTLHTQIRLSSILEIALKTQPSRRSILSESNCVCLPCLKFINRNDHILRQVLSNYKFICDRVEATENLLSMNETNLNALNIPTKFRVVSLPVTIENKEICRRLLLHEITPNDKLVKVTPLPVRMLKYEVDYVWGEIEDWIKQCDICGKYFENRLRFEVNFFSTFFLHSSKA